MCHLHLLPQISKGRVDMFIISHSNRSILVGICSYLSLLNSECDNALPLYVLELNECFSDGFLVPLFYN